MTASKGLWYFAHPYTVKDADGRYVPEGEEANFALANIRAGELLERGYNVYSPVSMTHAIHRASPAMLARHEHELWYKLDQDFMSHTDFAGIIAAPGWEGSTGCCAEVAIFRAKGKPVLFYTDIVRPFVSAEQNELQRETAHLVKGRKP